MAVMLGATGLVLPIEQVQPAFYARVSYYLNLINDQLSAHSLTLMLEITDTVNLDELLQFMQELPHQYQVLIESHRDMSTHAEGGGFTFYAHILDREEEHDETTLLPSWTQRYVIGANENVSHIRKNVQWVQAIIAQQHQSNIGEEENTTSDEPSPISADDEIT
jgi:hypothetical protein